MNQINPFEKVSYKSHETWFEKQYPTDFQKNELIKLWISSKTCININYWLHKSMFELALPIIQENESWLTVGDGYGFDASYLKEQNLRVVASDIGDSFLPFTKKNNLIDDYSIENVENLSFIDNNFDYTFCKEAFHHFPRAFLGIYEMLRVSKKGIILIEPQDPISRMPILLFLKNIMDRISPSFLQKFWKNRFSFESVGNYVFKLSERDIEKIAMGMNLPAMAIKGINFSYSGHGDGLELIENNGPFFKKLKRKLLLKNYLCWLGILPFQVISAIIFKEMPNVKIINKLKEKGYIFTVFPKNPFL